MYQSGGKAREDGAGVARHEHAHSELAHWALKKNLMTTSNDF